MSADEAAAQNSMREGDPVEVMGIAEGVGDNLISLNNGVNCYIVPEALSAADAAKLEPALGAVHVGDVVGMNGMLCDTDPFTLKYCGLPYQYYEGNKFYTEYEGFRRTGTYPDALYQALLREEQFWNQDIGEYAYCDSLSLSTMPGYTYETASFAIVDMNGDGKNEAVLRSVPRSESEEDRAYMVLYEDNGAVYGKSIPVTCDVYGLQIGGLQTNGLFWAPTGGAGSGYLCRCEISGDQLEVIHEALMEEDWRLKAWMGEPYTAYSDSADDTYWIRGREDVTKQEFYDYLDQAGWKDDGSMEAEFYDYTTEHILALLRE